MIQDFSDKTIFIIDDEEEILDILNKIIRNYINIKIEKFTCPLKALEALNHGNIPNLFIVDIKMPKLDGLEFFSEIKKLNIKKPTIFISGHAEKNEAVQCVKLGAFNLIDKPIDFDTFINSILQAINVEELRVTFENINRDKDYLINLYRQFTNKNEERMAIFENFVLDKTNLLNEDRKMAKNFLLKIRECNNIDREIFKISKEISFLLFKQKKVLKRNLSQEALLNGAKDE